MLWLPNFFIHFLHFFLSRTRVIHEKRWLTVDDGLEIAETTYQADGWKEPRRIVMVRQEIERRPNAAGKVIRQL